MLLFFEFVLLGLGSACVVGIGLGLLIRFVVEFNKK